MPPSHQPIEFSKINQHIYLGTNMCCTMHFSTLIKLGVKADVDLEYERLEKPKNLEIFLWLPTKDHTAPKPDQLAAGAMFLDSLVKKKIMAYVHCQKGHGRAPTLAAAYLVLKGKTPKQAVDYIKERRPITHLTKEQMDALYSYWRDLRRKNRK